MNITLEELFNSDSYKKYNEELKKIIEKQILDYGLFKLEAKE